MLWDTSFRPLLGCYMSLTVLGLWRYKCHKDSESVCLRCPSCFLCQPGDAGVILFVPPCSMLLLSLVSGPRLTGKVSAVSFVDGFYSAGTGAI